VTNRVPTSLWWRIVRFGFHLLYNQLAWTYDLVSWSVSLGHWRRWQRASIPYLEADSRSLILELAYGTGDLQIDLAHAGLYAVGLDLSPYMCRIARRKLLRRGLTPQLVRGSAMALPFPSGCFDAVVSTFPTEFIIRPETLHEVYRVLKIGGRLVVVPNGVLTLGTPVSRFLEWLYQITGQRGPWPVDPLAAFCEAGFSKVELKTETLPGSQVWIIIAVKSALKDTQ
jgi:ubiquinone/menaquinone biosynthesis C-methylase UbiE